MSVSEKVKHVHGSSIYLNSIKAKRTTNEGSSSCFHSAFVREIYGSLRILRFQTSCLLLPSPNEQVKGFFYSAFMSDFKKQIKISLLPEEDHVSIPVHIMVNNTARGANLSSIWC